MNTSIHQEFPPENIPRDNSGVLLEPGLRVAFNKSGYVTLGTIISIDDFRWKVVRPGVDPKKWWSLVCKIKVQEINSDHISTISNPNSIIVI